jgi:hypothetical protein
MSEERSDLDVTFIPAADFMRRELRNQLISFLSSSSVICGCFLSASLILYFLTIR